jgi:hypothetical protein
LQMRTFWRRWKAMLEAQGAPLSKGTIPIKVAA